MADSTSALLLCQTTGDSFDKFIIKRQNTKRQHVLNLLAQMKLQGPQNEILRVHFHISEMLQPSQMIPFVVLFRYLTYLRYFRVCGNS